MAFCSSPAAGPESIFCSNPILAQHKQRGAPCLHSLCFLKHSTREGWGPLGDVRLQLQPPPPHPQEQDDVLTQGCWAVVTQPTHSLSTNVTLQHFGNIPHPVTHPRLLHVERSHLHQKATQGERSQGIFVCTGSGKYSSTESLSKAMLLHKRKKYNPRLVKKQLPVFTLPAQKN